MFKNSLALFIIFISSTTQAGIRDIFKDEDGNTNWQHLANWSSGSLIIVLAIVILSLIVAHRRLRKSNHQLHGIRAELEDRVIERTATLDKANHNLTDTNQKLEVEVQQHLDTSVQLHSSESYIKNILASMPLVLVSIDAKGIVTQWNQKAEELSGIAATSAIGSDLWAVYPEIVLTWEQVTKVIESGETYTYPHRRRGIHFYDVTLYPLRGADKQGVVILVNDVSKQKQAENMLVHNEKIASMTELASAMAHDINTPLQGMLLDLQSFQQLLSKQSDTEVEGYKDMKLLLGLLSDASKRAETVASIVKNLLSFSRGRNEKKQVHDVTTLLDNAIMLASDMLILPGKLQFNKIEIAKEYQSELPLLNCYATELQQVFLNIIRHACYALEEMPHTPQGAIQAPKLTVSVNLEVDSLWVTLAHNGAILSDEEQTTIFEPSLSVILPQRDVDSQKRLSFANFIITDQHQGQMAVTSNLEHGTKFHIQLLLDTSA
ncbi:MAG: PAS domain S-box protein [Oceanospirillaceae bacterium]|nr:PAS domain S-box protein [Oceanospirillaceae bacterium]